MSSPSTPLQMSHIASIRYLAISQWHSSLCSLSHLIPNRCLSLVHWTWCSPDKSWWRRYMQYCSPHDWLVGWLDGWLIEWLVDILIDWLIDWSTDWLINWLVDWLIDQLIEWWTAVHLSQGCVYVPEISEDMMVSLVCNKFRARVSGELVVCYPLHTLGVVHPHIIYCLPSCALCRKLSITWQLSMMMNELLRC